jgi:GNAT superfamily N-acetyltransferase
MTASEITITRQLNEEQKDQAARLFYDSFSLKFDHFYWLKGDADRATALLRQGMNFENGTYALQDGCVIGGMALTTGQDGFEHYSFAIVRQFYGWLRGLWFIFRQQLFHSSKGRHGKDSVIVAELFVAESARGQGIGSRLLAEAEQHARTLGRQFLTLDVVDTNPGALRLYQRLGFEIIRTMPTGIFTKGAGFTKVYTMKKAVD